MISRRTFLKSSAIASIFPDVLESLTPKVNPPLKHNLNGTIRHYAVSLGRSRHSFSTVELIKYADSKGVTVGPAQVYNALTNWPPITELAKTVQLSPPRYRLSGFYG